MKNNVFLLKNDILDITNLLNHIICNESKHKLTPCN